MATEHHFGDTPPTAGVDLHGPMAAEVASDVAPALRDPQLRMLMGARTLQLLKRLKDSPRRKKMFERVRRDQIEPVEIVDADEGWYRDAKTGRWVVYEDQLRGEPYWVRECPFPRGVFTFGELAELDYRLWGAGEAFAEAAQGGLLDTKQRKAAAKLLDAAENIQMRLAVAKWRPDPKQAQKIKRQALEVLGGGSKRPSLRLVDNPRRIPRLPRANPAPSATPTYLTTDTWRYRGRIIELTPALGGWRSSSVIEDPAVRRRMKAAGFDVYNGDAGMRVFVDQKTAMAHAMSRIETRERIAAGDTNITDAEVGISDAIFIVGRQGKPLTRANVTREIKLWESRGWPYSMRAAAFNAMPLSERLAMVDFMIDLEKGKLR